MTPLLTINTSWGLFLPQRRVLGRNHNWWKVQSLLSVGQQFCSVGSLRFAWYYVSLEIFKLLPHRSSESIINSKIQSQSDMKPKMKLQKLILIPILYIARIQSPYNITIVTLILNWISSLLRWTVCGEIDKKLLLCGLGQQVGTRRLSPSMSISVWLDRSPRKFSPDSLALTHK